MSAPLDLIISGSRRPHVRRSNPDDEKSLLKKLESEIYYLIYSSETKVSQVIVYADHNLDLEWQADGAIEKAIDQSPMKEEFGQVIAGVTALEPLTHNWPKDLKLSFKRLLGEAYASSLRGDPKAAKAALEAARKFYAAKGPQVSRYWTLQICIALGLVCGLIGLAQAAQRDFLTVVFGLQTFLLLLTFWAGCFGAMLFVLFRFGKQPIVDSTAERHLHYLEGAARIIGGGAAGVLVGGMVKLGLFLPVFAHSDQQILAMCIAALVSGASERLAAGIITRTEQMPATKKGKANGTK